MTVLNLVLRVTHLCKVVISIVVAKALVLLTVGSSSWWYVEVNLIVAVVGLSSRLDLDLHDNLFPHDVLNVAETLPLLKEDGGLLLE